MERNINKSIEKGINFLENKQLETGEFPAYFGTDMLRKKIALDSTIFPTTIAAKSLQIVRHPKVEDILKKIELFLLEEEILPGVWKYWTKSHSNHKIIPNDLDDTACVSSFLRSRNISFQDNLKYFLLNRNKKNGLFYTWLVPRISHLKHDGGLKVFKNLYHSPLVLHQFYKKTEAAIDDIDTVVQANILNYLGERKETKAIIDHLNHIILENKESGCDKWYHSPFFLYYMIVNNMLQGVKFHKDVRSIIVSRIQDCLDLASGMIGENVLDTAIAVSTLCMLGNNKMFKSINYLLDMQMKDGSWGNYYFYYGGPKSGGPESYAGWCSECLTTSFCLEGLSNYTKYTSRLE